MEPNQPHPDPILNEYPFNNGDYSLIQRNEHEREILESLKLSTHTQDALRNHYVALGLCRENDDNTRSFRHVWTIQIE